MLFIVRQSPAWKEVGDLCVVGLRKGVASLVQKDACSLVDRFALPPNSIEARSFDIIGGLLPPLAFSEAEMQVVKRIVHTTGDPGIVEHIRLHSEAIRSGLHAIHRGATIATDVKMVAAGINKAIAGRFGCVIRCAMDSPDVAVMAERDGQTRAVVAMRMLADDLDGNIVAIGNAPTALFALLDLIDSGCRPPALVVGTPVGFVGAVEAKAELMKRHTPYITIEGTRGGSTIAVASVNALLKLGEVKDALV